MKIEVIFPSKSVSICSLNLINDIAKGRFSYNTLRLSPEPFAAANSVVEALESLRTGTESIEMKCLLLFCISHAIDVSKVDKVESSKVIDLLISMSNKLGTKNNGGKLQLFSTIVDRQFEFHTLVSLDGGKKHSFKMSAFDLLAATSLAKCNGIPATLSHEDVSEDAIIKMGIGLAVCFIAEQHVDAWSMGDHGLHLEPTVFIDALSRVMHSEILIESKGGTKSVGGIGFAISHKLCVPALYRNGKYKLTNTVTQ